MNYFKIAESEYKTIIFFIGILLFPLFINSCSTKKNKEIKLGFLYTSKNTDKYLKESKLFKEKAEQLGAKVFIEEANNDESVQYSKALELFDKNIDVLCIIAVNANTAAKIVRDADNRGIKVIAFDRMIKSDKLSLFISGNNEKLGKDMVNAVLKVKPSGNYIILSGDRLDRNAIELQKSVKSTLAVKKNKNRKVIYQSFIENWDKKNAAFELKQYLTLTGNKPDAIISACDAMSEGVIEVLEGLNMNPKEIPVTGQDAELQAVRNIIAGKQLITFYHPLKKLSYTLAKSAVNMAKDIMPDESQLTYTNNLLMKVPTIKISSIPVTKENIEEILIKPGVYTQEQLYN
ncbi:MAG: substrate-binding domain-containing protein [Chlorobi bacterium]|nr:substrate-binding domain-containing protein [Chlorobiota bacterium]